MTDLELMGHIRERITKNPYYHQIKDKTDRETIINDLFINVWEKINKGEMVNEWEEIKGYVFISGRNNCLKHLREKKRYRETHIDIDISDSNNFKYNDGTERMEHFIKQEEMIDFINNNVEEGIDKTVFDLRMKGMNLPDMSRHLNMDLYELEKINRTIIRYLRTNWFYPKFKERKGKWGDKTDFFYRVFDTYKNTTKDYTVKKRICEDVGINQNAINNHIGNRKLIKGRYYVQILKKNENKMNF
jgi:hypothetical protein